MTGCVRETIPASRTRLSDLQALCARGIERQGETLGPTGFEMFDAQCSAQIGEAVLTLSALMG